MESPKKEKPFFKERLCKTIEQKKNFNALKIGSFYEPSYVRIFYALSS
ncbi:hypothetical protein G5S_0896 [Chlamydia pecorum E58]|uniref:Uncharacterized protein n=1 Tax=Chlamydia pecorum (strain ATCC VR-628 / DSM 29919 / E58) TaxID=331635 RepID=A0AA34RDQ6_CHLPE|nr:hypothetical protein G5S_0896 [Chlamydia pecorum E58]